MNSASRMGTWGREVQDTARQMYDEFAQRVKGRTPFDDLPAVAKEAWFVAAAKRLGVVTNANAR